MRTEQVRRLIFADPASSHRYHTGYCRTYIVIPSTIYTVAEGPLADAGIQNKHSHQIPALIRASLARGQAGMVGKGLALWLDVHLDDRQYITYFIMNHTYSLVDPEVEFYMVLYDTIVKNGPNNVDHGVRGYYYGENGEHSWYDISKEIGRVMVELGLSKSDEPTSFTTDELVKYFGSEASISIQSGKEARG